MILSFCSLHEPKSYLTHLPLFLLLPSSISLTSSFSSIFLPSFYSYQLPTFLSSITNCFIMAPTKAKATPAKKTSTSPKPAKVSKDKVTKATKTPKTPKTTKADKTPKAPKPATEKARAGGRSKKWSNIYSPSNFQFLWHCLQGTSVFTHLPHHTLPVHDRLAQQTLVLILRHRSTTSAWAMSSALPTLPPTSATTLSATTSSQ